MTEHEAAEIMNDPNNFTDELEDYTEINTARKMAIDALREIACYRAIGTVKESKNCKDILNRAETGELAKIIDEWILYKKIGTVEELWEAREKRGESGGHQIGC